MTEQTQIKIDGLWHPEHWKDDRFLVTRYIKRGQAATREIHCEGRFGSGALIFESEESAQATADRLNSELPAGEESVASSEPHQAPAGEAPVEESLPPSSDDIEETLSAAKERQEPEDDQP